MSPELAPWHDFYSVLGEAAATLTGLLFVAASVGSGVFSQDRRGALRMFLSASVVQFGCILALSMCVLTPLQHWSWPGGMAVMVGLFGLAYSAFAWHGAMRDGLFPKIDLDDRIWYAIAPVAGYVLVTAAGFLLLGRAPYALLALAVAVSVLLTVAIHNAWDITVWSITRRRS